MQSNNNAQFKPTQNTQQVNTGIAPTSLFGSYPTNVQQPSLFPIPQQINQNVNSIPPIYNPNPGSLFNFPNSYAPQVQTTFQQIPAQQQYYPSAPRQTMLPPQQQTMNSSSPISLFGNYGGQSLRSQVETLKTISFADDELI